MRTRARVCVSGHDESSECCVENGTRKSMKRVDIPMALMGHSDEEEEDELDEDELLWLELLLDEDL